MLLAPELERLAGAHDWRAELPSLTMPTLIVHGTADAVVIDGAREWAARPNARLLAMPGVGHVPFVERPEVFFPAVETFLGGEWPEGAEGVAPDLAARDLPPYAALVRLFDYEASQPLDVREVSVQRVDGAAVHDLSFASPKGGRAPAYLVVPRGEGPFPAALFQHEAGEGVDRSWFLDEAVELARGGVASLLIGAPFTRPGAGQPSFGGGDDREINVQTVVDHRRGVDSSPPGPRAMLFQFGAADDLVARDDALRYYEAAGEPKEIRWYESGHDLPVAARRDRAEWLASRLGLER